MGRKWRARERDVKAEAEEESGKKQTDLVGG